MATPLGVGAAETTRPAGVTELGARHETAPLRLLRLGLLLALLAVALPGARLHRVTDAGLRPTLQDGDLLLLDLITYRIRGPYRGELVLRTSPGDHSPLGRVVAIGGDRIDSKVDGLRLNGAPLEEPYVQPPLLWLAGNPALGAVRGGCGDRDLLAPPAAHLGTGHDETLLVPADCVLVLPDERWRADVRPPQTLYRTRDLGGRALYLMAPMERRTWLF